jgi:hypothetical protein
MEYPCGYQSDYVFDSAHEARLRDRLDELEEMAMSDGFGADEFLVWLIKAAASHATTGDDM